MSSPTFQASLLAMMQPYHLARGFRGKAKGEGFRAYLESENIPPRKAYRLIERYRRLEAIWESVKEKIDALEGDLFPLPSLENIAELRAELQAICDVDPDTHEGRA